MFQARLAAEDIPAVVAHELHVGNAWHLSVALGGVKVQVPEERLEDAYDVARLCAAGEFRALLEAEVGDLDDVRCPNCGAITFHRRRPLPRAALAIAYSLCWGPICPPIGWLCICANCRTRFVPRPCYKTDKWLATAYLIPLFLLALFSALFCLAMIAACPPSASSGECAAGRAAWFERWIPATRQH
ncbi:MAG: hypothetical protein KGJ78_01495 [Alphaproteobacteria bacterium]|nr:hypothetical protein [Alphaproteobacteria bacterium]